MMVVSLSASGSWSGAIVLSVTGMDDLNVYFCLTCFCALMALCTAILAADGLFQGLRDLHLFLTGTKSDDVVDVLALSTVSSTCCEERESDEEVSLAFPAAFTCRISSCLTTILGWLLTLFLWCICDASKNCRRSPPAGPHR